MFGKTTFVLLLILVGTMFLGSLNGVQASGTLIKGETSTSVYYLANDGKRYVFPNNKTFLSWYDDYSGVTIVSDQDLSTFPIGGNITYRPGKKMVKIETDPKTYAVEKGGTLRWVTTEAVAQQLYGANWNQNIDDVPDIFFINYKIGNPIVSVSEFSPSSQMLLIPSINDDLAFSLPTTSGNQSSCSQDVYGCESWGACGSNGIQSRTCSLITDCPNVATPAPIAVQSCEAPAACTADVWNCGSWSQCSSAGAKSRSCEMIVDCPGVSTASPSLVSSCTPVTSCSSDTWTCSQWGACSSTGTQSRSCQMTSDCPEVSTASPVTSQSCTPVASCSSDTWTCGEWGSCSSTGTQSRSCQMTSDCPEVSTTSPATSQTCTPATSTLIAYANSTPIAQTYVRGVQGASFGGFTLRADGNATLKVTSIKLTPSVPSGGVTVDNYDNSIATAGLWNGSTQLGTTESPNSVTGELIFDNLNLTILAGQSVSINLKANVYSEASSGRYGYGFNSVSDVIVTGGTTSASNVVFPMMTVVEGGRIEVGMAPNDSETEPSLVVGGSSNVVLAKYKFKASDEELKLIKVRMQTATPTAVSSLSLYNGSTLLGGPIGVDGSGNADFTGLNFVIPKDGSATLTVKGNLGAVGVSGATTNSDVKVTLRDDAGTFEVRGTSAGSSTQILTTGVGNVAGNTKIIVKSKPTVSLVSLPSTLLSNGYKIVARFTISADAAGDVAVKKMNFNVALFGVGVSGVSGSSVRKVGGDYIAGTYNAGVAEFSAEEVIAAGTSMTYELVLTVTGSETDDAISTQLKDINWSDMSSSGGALIDGHLVKGIPVDSWTITR